jgi:hypothetical protein
LKASLIGYKNLKTISLHLSETVRKRSQVPQ